MTKPQQQIRKPNTSYLYIRTTEEEELEKTDEPTYGLELYNNIKLNPDVFIRERASKLINLAKQAAEQKILLITKGHNITTINRKIQCTLFKNVISLPVNPEELTKFIEHYKNLGGQ